jgi:hypothetical protein
MTGEDDQGPGTLLLAGYVPPFAEGFALPCYATGPQANSWYVAICSVDGDHEGGITGFEIFDVEGVLPLPEELRQSVSVGDPWQDVFLWAGRPHVGAPSSILQELDADLEAVAAEAPISLLDLTLFAGDIDIRPFVRGAFDHIDERPGRAMADNWFRETLIRGQTRLIVRRCLVAAGLAEKLLNDVRGIAVRDLTGKLQLTMPESIAAVLDGADQLNDLKDHIRILGGAVGADIDIELGGDSTRADPPMQVAVPDEEIAAEDSLHAARNILIIVSGQRAKAIARYLTAPEWLPILKGPSSADFPRYRLRREADMRRTWDGEVVARGVIDVVDEHKLPPALDNYGVIVWLADDRTLLHGPPDPLRDAFGAPSGFARDAVFLVAPALPVLEPSRILSDLKHKSLLESPFGCVIDTSLARSPFWTGNPRRAVDRRIGDIVVGSAMICATDGQLRKDLAHRESGSGLELFSFALETDARDNPDMQFGLLSESSSTGLRKPRRAGSRGAFVRFEVQPFVRSLDQTRSGYYSIRRHDPDFDGFVQAVIAGFRGPRSVDLTRSQIPFHRSDLFRAQFDVMSGRQLPPDVEYELVHPHLAAAARGSGQMSEEGIIVTAEAPSVAAVRAASDAGWTIVRYTDRETIWEAIADRRRKPRAPFPREMRLPPLHGWHRHHGLAVRGVDPRDIIRISFDDFEAWRSGVDESPLLDEARVYRADISEDGLAGIAIPRDAFENALRSGDRAAVKLGHMLREGEGSLHHGPLRRPGDLRAAWSAPGNDTRRFVLEDGRLPVSLMELPSYIVPTQRLFIIHGDGAVPALFLSRLFNIWARATLSQSIGWASRFSVRNTFEALPILHEFEVRHDETGIVQFRLGQSAGELESLIKKLNSNARRFARPLYADRPDGERMWDDHMFREEIDEVLLAMIGLPPHATDLDILDRLLTMSQEG